MDEVVVVMGVSGSGKSTVAGLLASELDVPFAEGDDFHSAANVAKMASGHPLTDADRLPWLESLAGWIGAHRAGGGVLTCSALRRTYRDRLGAAGKVWFAHVDAPQEVIAQRMAVRTGHFMPAELLRSQLATLEPLGKDEPGAVFDARKPPATVVGEVLRALRVEGESSDG